MEIQASLLPEISISLASPEEPPFEPFSPFNSQPSTPTTAVGEDSYRPTLLSPPPVLSPRLHSPSKHSPLVPDDAKNDNEGLDSAKFQRLLSSVSKRAPDLRKEIAIKVHKSKQLERRALFLSKINAPPSPSATFAPKTPPESPAIFHYTRRSPGLESPLSIYDSPDLTDESITPWVEQVDFRLATDKARAPSLPSLDQISARLSTQRHGPTIQYKPRLVRERLPAFLRAAKPEPVPVAKISARAFKAQPPTPRPVLPAAPLSKSPMAPTFAELMPPPPPPRARRVPPPLDPSALHVTTTIIPPMQQRVSPIKLTEANVAMLSSRARQGKDMMSTLRRRTSAGSVHERLTPVDAEERKARRISAPAELQRRPRNEFSHPVLALPGGF